MSINYASSKDMWDYFASLPTDRKRHFFVQGEQGLAALYFEMKSIRNVVKKVKPPVQPVQQSPCKPCNPDQVCNPDSKRCVSRTGPTGLRVLAAQSGIDPVNASNRFRIVNGSKVKNNLPKNPQYARKAPAGHAKNYAGKTAKGLDGNLWLSKLVGKSYRWVKA